MTVHIRNNHLNVKNSILKIAQNKGSGVMRILVCDDDERAQKDLKERLVKIYNELVPDERISISTFGNAFGLSDYIETKRLVVDAIFMDIILSDDGEMNGIDVAKNIKKEYPYVNIIFYTGTVIFQGNIQISRIANAIRAAGENVREAKQIKLDGMVSKEGFYLVVENSYETPVLCQDGEYMTTKTDRKQHGLGIRNVKAIAEKYDMTVDITTDNNVFRVVVQG